MSSPNIKVKPKIKCNTFCKCIFYAHVMKLGLLEKAHLFTLEYDKNIIMFHVWALSCIYKNRMFNQLTNQLLDI